MDRNVFVAVALCAGIFLLWQNFYLKPHTQISSSQHTESAQKTAVQTQNSQTTPQTAIEKANAPALTGEKQISLGQAPYTATISTRGGVVTQIDFASYRGRPNKNLDDLIGGGKQLELAVPDQAWAYLQSAHYQIKSQSQQQLVLAFEDQNIWIERQYTLNPEKFLLDHKVNVKFKKQAPAYLFVGLQAKQDVSKDLQENERRELQFHKLGSKIETWANTDLNEVKEDMSDGRWMAFSSRYFLKALVDQGSGQNPQLQARPIADGMIAASLIYKTTGASSLQIPQTFYFGPKEIETLKSVGQNLDLSVDFGWFTFFAYPLLKTLKWFYKYVHNYGIAIILLTILVKILTYPLTYKSMKSMKEMQRIQPQLQKIREKYKDDKEKLNQEMLSLMRSNGYNPMSGCLPIFIQMPVFIALYNVLFGCIDLYGTPFFGWITDLSAKDPYFVTPVLLGGLMFLQQKLTPTTTVDPAQQKMMLMTPVIFSVMMLWLPSGLTLYMLVNSITSIIQQLAINKKLGISTTTSVATA